MFDNPAAGRRGLGWCPLGLLDVPFVRQSARSSRIGTVHPR